MLKLADRIARDGITSTATFEDHTRDADGWEHDAWTVTLRRVDPAGVAPFVITVPFRMGTGLNGVEPDTEMVLSALLSDAASVSNSTASFEAWAADYGYDTDSRRAERFFRASVDELNQLRGFLGGLFDAYVWETDTD